MKFIIITLFFFALVAVIVTEAAPGELSKTYYKTVGKLSDFAENGRPNR